MRQHSAVWYELRVGLGLTAWLPALLLPAYAALLWLLWHYGLADRQLTALERSFELILPLAAGLGAAHLMAVEREARFDELRATYPEPRWRLPVVRTAGALLVGLVSALAGAALFRCGFGPFDLRAVLLPGIAPALYLTGISLLVGNLAGSYWAAAGTIMGYWFFEVLQRGQQTQWIFLFARTWPLEEVSYGANRWLLAGAGLGLLLLNIWLSMRRRGG